MKTAGRYCYIHISEKDNKEKVLGTELLGSVQWFGVWTATGMKFQQTANQETSEVQ